MTLTLFILSLIGGLMSGILGLGGAVIMIPMMLAIPPLVGVGHLSMQEVAGISMLQVLAASVSGCLAHRQSGHVHTRMLLAIGIPMGLFSLLGAFLSKFMDSHTLLYFFGALVLTGFILLLVRKENAEAPQAEADLHFNLPLAVGVGVGVGFAAGVAGAGGGFILVPLMIVVLNMPMRVTVGTSLGVVFIGALLGSAGKLMAVHIEWPHVLAAVLGSIPAAQLGARLSRAIPPHVIRYLLLALVFLSLLRTCWEIVAG